MAIIDLNILRSQPDLPLVIGRVSTGEDMFLFDWANREVLSERAWLQILYTAANGETTPVPEQTVLSYDRHSRRLLRKPDVHTSLYHTLIRSAIAITKAYLGGSSLWLRRSPNANAYRTHFPQLACSDRNNLSRNQQNARLAPYTTQVIPPTRRSPNSVKEVTPIFHVSRQLGELVADIDVEIYSISRAQNSGVVKSFRKTKMTQREDKPASSFTHQVSFHSTGHDSALCHPTSLENDVLLAPRLCQRMSQTFPHLASLMSDRLIPTEFYIFGKTGKNDLQAEQFDCEFSMQILPETLFSDKQYIILQACRVTQGGIVSGGVKRYLVRERTSGLVLPLCHFGFTKTFDDAGVLSSGDGIYFYVNILRFRHTPAKGLSAVRKSALGKLLTSRQPSSTHKSETRAANQRTGAPTSPCCVSMLIYSSVTAMECFMYCYLSPAYQSPPGEFVDSSGNKLGSTIVCVLEPHLVVDWLMPQFHRSHVKRYSVLVFSRACLTHCDTFETEIQIGERRLGVHFVYLFFLGPGFSRRWQTTCGPMEKMNTIYCKTCDFCRNPLIGAQSTRDFIGRRPANDKRCRRDCVRGVARTNSTIDADKGFEEYSLMVLGISQDGNNFTVIQRYVLTVPGFKLCIDCQRSKTNPIQSVQQKTKEHTTHTVNTNQWETTDSQRHITTRSSNRRSVSELSVMKFGEAVECSERHGVTEVDCLYDSGQANTLNMEAANTGNRLVVTWDRPSVASYLRRDHRRPTSAFRGEPGSIPGGVAPRYSNAGIVPDSFRRCSILASITLIDSQDLAASHGSATPLQVVRDIAVAGRCDVAILPYLAQLLKRKQTTEAYHNFRYTGCSVYETLRIKGLKGACLNNCRPIRTVGEKNECLESSSAPSFGVRRAAGDEKRWRSCDFRCGGVGRSGYHVPVPPPPPEDNARAQPHFPGAAFHHFVESQRLAPTAHDVLRAGEGEVSMEQRRNARGEVTTTGKQCEGTDLLVTSRPSCVTSAGSPRQILQFSARHVILHVSAFIYGAVVAERLACSPPTKANRDTPGSSRAGIVPDNTAGRWVFSGIFRFSWLFHCGHAPCLSQSPSSVGVEKFREKTSSHVKFENTFLAERFMHGLELKFLRAGFRISFGYWLRVCVRRHVLLDWANQKELTLTLNIRDWLAATKDAGVNSYKFLPVVQREAVRNVVRLNTKLSAIDPTQDKLVFDECSTLRGTVANDHHFRDKQEFKTSYVCIAYAIGATGSLHLLDNSEPIINTQLNSDQITAFR
ncbi:hypothetical protein PR048_033159 [Dryococelus australis]|uniref:Uncharacterized protein n=1 Tax=Dryococelus australis TaxID=614101 RepID=A0ABQ9FZG4_9NEOP|nr:hypothetical protein PR048_033159 [Dryococelus australis]